MFRRSPFANVIGAQLDLFVRDHPDGDYVDAVETGTEILADVRDHYARTVDDPDRYCIEFNRAVARRMPAFALEIENR
jgi:hypothetical protein